MPGCHSSKVARCYNTAPGDQPMSNNDNSGQKSSEDFRLTADLREDVAERAPHANGHWFAFGEPAEGGR